MPAALRDALITEPSDMATSKTFGKDCVLSVELHGDKQ